MSSMKKVFVSVFVVFCVVFMLSPLYAEQAKIKKVSPCAVELKKANERIVMLEQKLAQVQAMADDAEKRAGLAEARLDGFKAALNQKTADDEKERIAESRQREQDAKDEQMILKLEGILTDLEVDAEGFANEAKSWRNYRIFGMTEDSKIWKQTDRDLNRYNNLLWDIISKPEVYNRFMGRNRARLGVVSTLKIWIENPRAADPDRDNYRKDQD